MLEGYAPRSPLEAADLERIRSIVQSGDAWSRATPLHLTGSALVVHPASKRVLLRWHERQQAWLQVGGHADPGEDDPFAVAVREAREETGLSDLQPFPDASPLHVVVVPVPAGKGEPAHEHADIRFGLATNAPESVLPEADNAQLEWLTMSEAMTRTCEDNLRETLSRLGALLCE